MCVCIHFNWIYIVSLFAVVFNSFRRSRQPFIHMQLLSVELNTILDNKKYNFSIGTCRWGVLYIFNINASIDSNTYLNFWFQLSPWKWRHAFFIIHSVFKFVGVQICFIFLSFLSDLLNMSREIWNLNKKNVCIDSSLFEKNGTYSRYLVINEMLLKENLRWNLIKIVIL